MGKDSAILFSSHVWKFWSTGLNADLFKSVGSFFFDVYPWVNHKQLVFTRTSIFLLNLRAPELKIQLV